MSGAIKPVVMRGQRATYGSLCCVPSRVRASCGLAVAGSGGLEAVGHAIRRLGKRAPEHVRAVGCLSSPDGHESHDRAAERVGTYVLGTNHHSTEDPASEFVFGSDVTGWRGRWYLIYVFAGRRPARSDVSVTRRVIVAAAWSIFWGRNLLFGNR